MDDLDIIKLYWERNEHAIAETSGKYGHFCYQIAYNILSVREDSEECVNDTWHQTWNSPMKIAFQKKRWLSNYFVSVPAYRKFSRKKVCGYEKTK